MKHTPVHRPRTRRVAAPALAAVLASALAACERTPAPGAGPETGAKPAEPTGFVEEAKARGLDFRMHFLSGEQGSKFKINLYDHGTGVVIDDADGDGDDDVYLLDQLGPNRLFRNDGGKFADVTEAAGVGLADRISVGAAFGDLDGDGDADLFVTSTRGGNALFRNDGNLRFTEVTREAGVALVAHSQSPILFDLDGDGDLDLFVTNTAQWTLDTFVERERYFEGPASFFELVAAPPEKNVLYRNDGGMRFTEIAAQAGLEGNGWNGDAVPFDFDEDGDLDLFVANMFGGTRLYRNDAAKFTDVTADTLVAPPWGAVGARMLDYDGDGRLDLYVADMHSDMWIDYQTGSSAMVREKTRFSGPEGPVVDLGMMSTADRDELHDRLRIPKTGFVYGTALFRATGGGKFEDVTEKSHADTWWPWGVAVADFDLNGWPDVFLPSGMGRPWFYWRSSLLLNQGDGTFDERGRDFGIDPLPDGPHYHDDWGRAARSFRCAAVGDFDSDGRPDLIASGFNDRANLWMNRFPRRRWMTLRLDGTNGPREAIGAVVTVTAGGRSQTQMVQTTGGYLSQSTRTLFFGLGDAAKADKVEIRWPGGARQTVADLAADRMHEIAEPRR